MSVLETPVLVLNQSWMAVDTIVVRGAFTHLFSGACRFLNPDDSSLHELESWIDLPAPADKVVRTAYLEIRMPEIIVLKSHVTPTKKIMCFSRRNLLRRDRMTCQYCGSRPGQEQLTIDHIVPRNPKGGGVKGKSSWGNCVMACKQCNTFKANRTPAQAGMSLIPRAEMQLAHPSEVSKWNFPYEPAWSPVFKVSEGSFQDSWAHFLKIAKARRA